MSGGRGQVQGPDDEQRPDDEDASVAALIAVLALMTSEPGTGGARVGEADGDGGLGERLGRWRARRLAALRSGTSLP